MNTKSETLSEAREHFDRFVSLLRNRYPNLSKAALRNLDKIDELVWQLDEYDKDCNR
jgi:hypothetical protein